MTTMKELNLGHPQFKPTAHATYRQLRAERPIEPVELANGDVMWCITRYDDIVAVMRDERFVKNYRSALNAEETARISASMPLLDFVNNGMLFVDPPDHTRLRSLVAQAFTPRRIEDLRPRIEALAAELLDAMDGHETADLIEEYAFPLPIAVISELLGVPHTDRQRFRTWSDYVVKGALVPNEERTKAMQAFGAYLFELVAERRATPRDDMVTALVQASADGDRLSENDLVAMILLLIVAGHETTVNLIGNGALALLTHPDQLALLQQQPELINGAVEEFLRFDGPVETSTMRFAREDVTLHGHTIRRGQRVLVVLDSANRDEAHFASPDDLDITRQIRQHLAFGHGIHYCLGAPLARMEGQIAIGRLIQRFPQLALAVPAEQLEYRPSVLIRGLVALPVQLKPSEGA